MYRRIIVPLDGSERGGQSLAYAKLLASAFHSEIVTLRVVIPQVTGTADATKEAKAYVDRVSAQLQDEGFKVSAKTPASRVPSLRIAAEADQEADNLVCMSSHGLTGIRRWFLGNIANEVLKSTKSPVLIVRKDPSATTANDQAAIRNIVAPLDGTSSAEQAIPHVETLAKTFQANIHIVYVETTSKSRSTQKDMPAYLDGMASRMRENANVPVEVLLLKASDPADAITKQAQGLEGQMIVMTTHSRVGFHEMLLGAMADRLAHRATGPILFIHPNSGR